MPRDETAWTRVEGDHADDASYVRAAPAPGAQSTDEVLTTEEIEATAAEVAVEGEYDATESAIAAAAELGVDLSTVTGTGVDGRIIKSDVEAAAA